MIDKYNNWLIRKYISSCSVLNEFDRERIEYSLHLILDESEKLIALILVFLLAGHLDVFVLAFIVLMSLRTFIGGLHFPTRGRCFCFTLVFFTIVIVSSEVITINKWIGLLVCGLVLLNIVLCAPLPSKHRILVSDRGKRILKKRAIIMMSVWIVVYMMLHRIMSNIILWTVMMQQLELLYYKIFKHRKGA